MENLIKKDNEVIQELIDILNKCYYVALEINHENSKFFFIISNSKEKKKYISVETSAMNISDFKNYYSKKILILLKKKTNKKIYSLPINNNSLIIFYYKNKATIKYCDNIYEYIEKESKYRKWYLQNDLLLKYSNKIYYRGNKLNFDLSTSLYRNDKIAQHEHLINNRIIQNIPSNFNNCDSFFEKLTILKHFNAPSRLLDITENPLIAAFFALDNNKEFKSNYGSINLCFPHDKQEIKNSQNSDSITLLSALCTTNKKISSTDVDQLLINFDKFFIFFGENINNLENAKTEIIKILYSIQGNLNSIKENKSLNPTTLKKFKELSKEIDCIFKNKILNQSKSASDLKIIISRDTNIFLTILNLVKELPKIKYFFNELQHQAALINPEFRLFKPQEKDINSFYIVQPSVNNDRIKNQKGLFIMIGVSKNTDDYYLKGNTTYLSLFNKKIKEKKIKNTTLYLKNTSGFFEDNDERVIFIINNRKNKFYEELDKTFGINKGYIYPELENQVTQIKNDIMFEYGIKTN